MPFELLGLHDMLFQLIVVNICLLFLIKKATSWGCGFQVSLAGLSTKLAMKRQNLSYVAAKLTSLVLLVSYIITKRLVQLVISMRQTSITP
jgi:hypothetical protein